MEHNWANILVFGTCHTGLSHIANNVEKSSDLKCHLVTLNMSE